MTRIEIQTSNDAGLVLRDSKAFLTRTPVENNLVLTILHERAEHSEPGLYWTVSADGQIAGLVLQSPPAMPAVLTAVPPGCIEELVNRMAGDRPDLPGIRGEAVTTARFAGYWAERLKIPVAPVEALRLYRLTALRSPQVAPGLMRTANEFDLGLVIEWLQGFQRDTGATVAPPDVLRRRIAAGLISIWDDGKPVSMAAITKPVAQTVRVGLVYTPPEHRRRGYAASIVAAVSRAALRTAASQCVLYTQLSNPQSNAIYQRLGYEPVLDLLRYRFG
jgi:RimJ/RimL family protein N-acetyltransferase